LFGSIDPGLPVDPSIPFMPSVPGNPSAPEKLALNATLYRNGMSRSAAFTAGWLGTVISTLPVFPSLARGSAAKCTFPLLSKVTTCAVVCRSFHITLPLPAPSVCTCLPSVCVTVTISGAFCPGATPGELAIRASIEATSTFVRSTRIPSFTFIALQELSAITAISSKIKLTFERSVSRNGKRAEKQRGRVRIIGILLTNCLESLLPPRRTRRYSASFRAAQK
jgi:hypothetical protein